MRLVFAAFALALIGAVFFFAPSTTPAADASCNPGRSSNWDKYQVGWYREPGSTVWGVKAEIKEYDPYVSPSGAYSAAWVMVETPGRWAQAGWKQSKYTRNVFAQWIDANGGGHEVLAAPKQIGSSTEYMVFYSGGRFYFYADSQWFASDWAGFTPTRATIAGEITNLASQMPGGYNLGSEERLYTSYYRDSSHNWKAFDWGGGG